MTTHSPKNLKLIVWLYSQFQGFNWESWRRDWWLELSPKAADLSRCGITTIWLPPPTHSVAPQGIPTHCSTLYCACHLFGNFQQLIVQLSWPVSSITHPRGTYSFEFHGVIEIGQHRQTMQSYISNYMRRIHAGYMPGDLYNMNSAYGTEDELKQCIAEMHNHNILVCSANSREQTSLLGLFNLLTFQRGKFKCLDYTSFPLLGIPFSQKAQLHCILLNRLRSYRMDTVQQQKLERGSFYTPQPDF